MLIQIFSFSNCVWRIFEIFLTWILCNEIIEHKWIIAIYTILHLTCIYYHKYIYMCIYIFYTCICISIWGRYIRGEKIHNKVSFYDKVGSMMRSQKALGSPLGTSTRRITLSVGSLTKTWFSEPRLAMRQQIPNTYPSSTHEGD